MQSTEKNTLIIENSGLAMAGRAHFPDATAERLLGFEILHASIERAEYHTVVCGEIWKEDVDRRMRLGGLCGNIISHYLEKHGIKRCSRILFVGLGNPDSVPDSLGYAIAKKITPTAGVDGVAAVYSFPALIPGMTGFDTFRLIKALRELSQAEVIICADSLTALSRERLQSVIQITDVGISPGSGVDKCAEEISHRTMGVPVISVGVPMAIFEDVLTDGYTATPALLTRAECDVIRDTYATVIAHGLRCSFFRK